MAQKRASDALVAMPDMKRARNELVAITNRDKALLEAVSKILVCFGELQFFAWQIKTEIKILQGVKRTSSLFAPIMLLEGHEGEVFSCEFHPEGEHLLSTGFDRKIRKCFFIIIHLLFLLNILFVT